MTSSGFVDTYDKDSKNFALPYKRETEIDWLDCPGVTFACADVVSSATDLYKWVKGLKSGKIISTNSFHKMTGITGNVNDSIDYGYGFIMYGGENAIVHHGGHLPSYYSDITFPLYGDYVQIVLSNYSYDNISLFAAYLANDAYNVMYDIEPTE